MVGEEREKATEIPVVRGVDRYVPFFFLFLLLLLLDACWAWTWNSFLLTNGDDGGDDRRNRATRLGINTRLIS